MKNLNKIRDELAHARAVQIDKKYKPNEFTVYANARRSYIKGFDSCLKELEPTIKELVDALEQMVGHTVAHLQFPHKDTSSVTIAIITARETLEKYKQKTGEK